MEIVEDLLYALAGDNPGSLLLELSELFLQINVEKTELVGSVSFHVGKSAVALVAFNCRYSVSGAAVLLE